MTVRLTDDQGRVWRLGNRPLDSKVDFPFRGDVVGHIEIHGVPYPLMKRDDMYFIRDDNTGTGHRVIPEIKK